MSYRRVWHVRGHCDICSTDKKFRAHGPELKRLQCEGRRHVTQPTPIDLPSTLLRVGN
jgi:hypothetical protein